MTQDRLYFVCMSSYITCSIYLSGRIDLTQVMTVVKTIFIYFYSIFYVVKIPTICFGQERMGLVKQRFLHHI